MNVSFKLERFEGPLDLLLHLIAQSEVSVQDIFVSEITEQYLAYIAQMDQADMELSSEFLTMAATLLHIKSRSLLPKPAKEEDEEDPEQLLILQLQEYKRIKQVSDQLQQMEKDAAKSYYKLPEEFRFQQDPLNLDGVDTQTLCQALTLLLEKKEAERLREPRVNVVRAETFSVRDKIALIRNRLQHRTRMCFTELFADDATRTEVIATFLALLELVAAGQAAIEQPERYGEIQILAR